MSENRKIIEAALFMSPNAMSFADLLALSKNVLDLRKAITELHEIYSEENSSIEIAETSAGFQMKVRSDYADKVAHLAASSEFGKSVLKTLAFIAYKQPIKQSTIIKYRSNKAYDDIKQLEDEGFISRERRGRTYIIRTTRKFVKYFGENAVKLLPREQPEPDDDEEEEEN